MANCDGEPEDDDDVDDDDGNDDDTESNENVCWKYITSGDDSDFNGVIDRIEQDIVTAFLCAGCRVDDEEARHTISECVQDELLASSHEKPRRSEA